MPYAYREHHQIHTLICKGRLLQLQSERWIIYIYRNKIRINEISRLYKEEFEKEIWKDLEAYGAMSFESVREERHSPYSFAGEKVIGKKWITATIGIFKLVNPHAKFNIEDELAELPYHLQKHEILTPASTLLWKADIGEPIAKNRKLRGGRKM